MPDHHHVLTDEQLIEMYSKTISLNCVLHGEKLDNLIETVTKLEFAIMGNGSKGILQKSNEHEGYFKMLAGASALIGVVFAIVRVIL